MPGLVKVIVTLGPASWSRGIIRKLIGAGASGFRVNLSYGNPSTWAGIISNLESSLRESGAIAGVIGDLEGPRARLGEFQELPVRPGERLKVSREEGIVVDNEGFFEVVDVGDTVLVDDGSISFKVAKASLREVVLEAENEGLLRPRKGIVVKGKEIPCEGITPKDREALKFISGNPFSHVMISFASSKEQVEAIRRFLRDRGRPDVKLLAKIESPGGVRNLREIAEASDGVVVARGDLGMHFGLEEVPLIQDMIVREARRVYKPVILATQFLASMISESAPTRSEVVDIFTAVKSAPDALLLTSETAIGRRPDLVVEWMMRVVRRAESEIRVERERAEIPIYRLAKGLVELSESLNATLIVYSMTGKLPERVSAFRPTKPYYVGVPTPETARIVSILWGATPVIVGSRDYEEGLHKTLNYLLDMKLIKSDDLIVEASWSNRRNFYMVRVRNVKLHP